jgi:hypothetical protein
MSKDNEDRELLDSILSPDVRNAIQDLQLALLRKSKDAIEDCDDVDTDPIEGKITAEQLVALLMAVISGQTTAQQNAQILSAISGQTGTQQGNQQATQQAAEIIAALTGRTVTQTTHLADVNGPERILATVARGVDNNELISQRINHIGANVAELASIGIGVLLTSTPVVAAQLQAQVADQGSKNASDGRLVGDCIKSGHGDCHPCYKKD